MGFQQKQTAEPVIVVMNDHGLTDVLLIVGAQQLELPWHRGKRRRYRTGSVPGCSLRVVNESAKLI